MEKTSKIHLSDLMNEWINKVLSQTPINPHQQPVSIILDSKELSGIFGCSKGTLLNLFQQKSVITYYINPVITAHSEEIYLGDEKKDHQMEGCLSIPKVWGHVWRWRWIDLRYQTLDDPGSKSAHDPGSYLTKRFTGFPARVLQHEYDHLDGILFTDHLLNKSPISGFKTLKTHSNHLFFDVDDQFIPIDNPTAFARW